MTITAAVPVDAGTFRAPGAAATAAAMNTPAFCRVAATLAPTPESHIRIEVWLPPAAAWNGKFLGTGNGGAGGVISYPALAAGLQKGYATTNTDMGTSTTGLDFSFGVGHREMVVDWGYRATHLMTVVAKQIAKTYYTRDPQQSYFMGCSTGGHQAITEARRYPDDYNGIVAGDPANNRVRLHMNGYWAYEATHDDPASYIPPAKLPMINSAVLNACDKIDGLADGIIDDPRKCTFDLASLQCKGADAADCLTAPQVAAMKKIYQGPKNPRTGELIFPGMYVGSEINPLGLDRTLANAPDSGRPASAAGPGDLDQLEGARLRLGQGRVDGHRRAVAGARRCRSGSERVQEARRQAAALHRLGRSADSGRRSPELLRGHAEEDGRRAGDGGIRAALHGARHGPLRRRQRADPLRRARRARAVGRERRGARKR